MIQVPESVREEAKAGLAKQLDDIMDGLVPESDIYGFVCEETRAAETPEERTTREAEEKGRFAIYCGLCNTMMYGTEAQIGQKLQCPDCGRDTIVQKPLENLAPDQHITQDFEGTNQYELSAEIYGVNEESASPPVNPPSATGGLTPAAHAPALIPVICTLCATRMHATEDQIGIMKTCPDCGTQTMVVRPRPEATDDREAPIESYGVSTPEAPTRPQMDILARMSSEYVEKAAKAEKAGRIERLGKSTRPPQQPPRKSPNEPRSVIANTSTTRIIDPDPIDMETIRERAVARRAAEEEKRQADKAKAAEGGDISTFYRPRPPRMALTTNLLKPLRYWDFNRHLTKHLCFGAVIVPSLLIGTSLHPAVGIFFLMIAGLLTVFWMSVMSIDLLSIFNNTSAGSDECTDMEDFDFTLGGVVPLFWLLTATAIGITPGLLLCFLFHTPPAPGAESWGFLDLLGHNPLEGLALIGLSHIIFFPVVFLSYIETGIPLLGRNTLASLFRVPLHWLGHLLLSGLVRAIFALLAAVCLACILTGNIYLTAFGLMLFWCCATAVPLLLFRLLGRLAWVIEDNLREE